MATITPSSTDFPLARTVAHAGWSERHTCCTQVPWHGCDVCMGPPAGWNQTTLVDRHCFGNLPCVALRRWESTRGMNQTPVTALLAKPGAPVGMHIEAVTGIDARPLRDARRVLGYYWEDADAVYCHLGGVRPTNISASRGDQTRQVLHIIRNILENIGLDFCHVVRTWFYNDHIVDWYAEFNEARTGFFRQRKISVLPASTGIGVANAGGSALVAKLIAVKPKTHRVTIRRVDSPLQCEASRYGSSFSRAMEVADSKSRVLYISGTASIEPGGRTVHVGDTAKQIEKTMEVVNALLKHDGMCLSDTTRAIAYFRHQEDMGLWHEYMQNRELPRFPVNVVQCDICRADLLFEIELDAAATVCPFSAEVN